MRIEFVKGPDCLGNDRKLNIKTLKRAKDGINFEYNNKMIFIPWSNIVAIEEDK